MTRPEPPLDWLVLRAQSGDQEAVEHLLLRTQRHLGTYITAMIGDRDAAADVLQEVLITVYRKLGALREPRAYTAWTRRIASRAVLASVRSGQRPREHAELEADLPAAEPSPEDEAMVRHDLPVLLSAVSPLSREVLVMRYLQDLPLEEIAVILGVPLGTVKSRLGYAMQTLRHIVRAG